MNKIMFVCHGNICRSVMAEMIFKEMLRKNNELDKYIIDSTATSREEIGNGIYYEAKKVLEAHNIPYTNHLARQITKEDYNKFDLMLVMDIENFYSLKRITSDTSKIKYLGNYAKIGEISDPWYTRNFEKCYEEISKCLIQLYKELEINK